MNIEIKPTKDHQLLASLNETIQTLHLKLYPREFKAYNHEEVKKAFKEMLSDPNARAWLAMNDDNAIGYVFCFIKEKPENAFQYEKTLLYIDQIMVLKDHRHQGVAKKMMDKVFSIARELGIDEVHLDHWESNLVAQEFFTKAGFKCYKHLFKKNL